MLYTLSAFEVKAVPPQRKQLSITAINLIWDGKLTRVRGDRSNTYQGQAVIHLTLGTLGWGAVWRKKLRTVNSSGYAVVTSWKVFKAIRSSALAAVIYLTLLLTEWHTVALEREKLFKQWMFYRPALPLHALLHDCGEHRLQRGGQRDVEVG